MSRTPAALRRRRHSSRSPRDVFALRTATTRPSTWSNSLTVRGSSRRPRPDDISYRSPGAPSSTFMASESSRASPDVSTSERGDTTAIRRASPASRTSLAVSISTGEAGTNSQSVLSTGTPSAASASRALRTVGSRASQRYARPRATNMPRATRSRKLRSA